MPDPQALLRPLSAEAPCGPDLDAEGDLDYMNLMARIEGDLPASFFSFDRGSIDFKSDGAALTALLERSLDLRPVVMLAKLAVLNRDLAGFADWLTVARELLATHWNDVHPAASDGQTGLRSAVLQSFDDLPTVVLPLQYAPLVTSRRAGPISFRSHLASTGEVQRREGEPEIDAATIAQAMSGTETAEIVALHDVLARVVGAVEGIRKTWMIEAGFDDAPALDRLTKLSGRMLAFVEQDSARRAPQAAEEPATEVEPSAVAETAAPAYVGAPAKDAAFRVDSAAAASRALAASAAYLSSFEPSSPALLLIQQAQQCVGLGFVAIMRLLMPDTIDDAKIVVGGEQPFVFRVDRMSDVEPATEVDGAETGEEIPGPVLQSRRDVQQTLDRVAAFYKIAEPSNPIPLLCDKARGMCAQDFAALLRDMMPKRS